MLTQPMLMRRSTKCRFAAGLWTSDVIKQTPDMIVVITAADAGKLLRKTQAFAFSEISEVIVEMLQPWK